MKQITINVYKFSELNEEAQAKAIADAKKWIIEGQQEIIGDCFWYTLDKVEEVFGIKVDTTEYTNGTVRIKWSWKPEMYRWASIYTNALAEEEGREGWQFLVRYLNWVDTKVNAMKAYYLPHEKHTRRHITAPKRVSKVMYGGYKHCLTDDYSDQAIDEALEHRWDSVYQGLSIQNFIDDMLRDLRWKWEKELAETRTDDYARDLLDDTFSETYYFEDGRVAEA